MILELTHRAIYLVILISGLPLVAAVVCGLITSIIQAATSVQEQTSLYLIKLLSLAVSLSICSKWFATELYDFLKQCLTALSLKMF